MKEKWPNTFILSFKYLSKLLQYFHIFLIKSFQLGISSICHLDLYHFLFDSIIYQNFCNIFQPNLSNKTISVKYYISNLQHFWQQDAVLGETFTHTHTPTPHPLKNGNRLLYCILKKYVICTSYSKKHVICTAYSKKHSKSRQKKEAKKAAKKAAKRQQKRWQKSWQKKIHQKSTLPLTQHTC